MADIALVNSAVMKPVVSLEALELELELEDDIESFSLPNEGHALQIFLQCQMKTENKRLGSAPLADGSAKPYPVPIDPLSTRFKTAENPRG